MSQILSEAELAELERVYQQATEGQWEYLLIPQCQIQPHVQAKTDTGHYTVAVPVHSNPETERNMQSIAALHNAFPRLLATIRQLSLDRNRLDWLESSRFGVFPGMPKHKHDYWFVRTYDNTSTTPVGENLRSAIDATRAELCKVCNGKGCRIVKPNSVPVQYIAFDCPSCMSKEEK